MTLKTPYELPDETMTTTEVARMVRRTNRTVRQWCKDGKLRFWKIDGSRDLLIDVASVRDLFETSER